MCAMISGLFIGSNDGRPPQAYKENIVSLISAVLATMLLMEARLAFVNDIIFIHICHQMFMYMSFKDFRYSR